MNTKGIGLGLVIAQQITNEFSGKIQYESKSDKGSIFTFKFRLSTD